jgi:hypothetical protein
LILLPVVYFREQGIAFSNWLTCISSEHSGGIAIVS